jgi:cutinase
VSFPFPLLSITILIFEARGTSEPGDLGIIVGDPLVARVKRDMPGVNVRGYPVQVSGCLDLTEKILTVQYPAGVSGSSTGVEDVQKRIDKMLRECPDTKFALAGYSQGGMVVLSAASKLPANLAEKVLAMVIYGAGEATNVKGPLKDRTLANCAPGDFVSLKLGIGKQILTVVNPGMPQVR